MTEKIFYRPKINLWRLYFKLIVFFGLIFIVTLWWAKPDMPWLNDWLDLLLYVVIVVVICWHYKIKASWEYSGNDLAVYFYFNLFGYQKIIVKSGTKAQKKEFLSYSPQVCEFRDKLFLQFTSVNSEVGGFGLYLSSKDEILTPDHIDSDKAT